MIWTKWLPLRYIIRKAAHSQGFLDPLELLARLRSFAQPSEVGEPVELLRAGMVFHARGLINSRIIQYNLDWVWPYWVARQFDPCDVAFVPRAFSFSHINLTHRNWTAIGYPDFEELPIVDPCGLLTPFYDGWSLDAWIISDDGDCLLPSRTQECEQQQDMHSGLSVITQTGSKGLTLNNRCQVTLDLGRPVCNMTLTASADKPARLVLALRPHNPEGISFIHHVTCSSDRKCWTVDDSRDIEFSLPAERCLMSNYAEGDVFFQLENGVNQEGAENQNEGSCDTGLVTAAAIFTIPAGEQVQLTASINLANSESDIFPEESWTEIRSRSCKLVCPDSRYQFLFDAAVSSLILHSPDDVYPGPYTYKRFWFRDAAFMIHALLNLGLSDRAARALKNFPDRQTALGYFRSQEGEWDANGEVLWILQRFHKLTGKALPSKWLKSIERGAHWIIRKRLDENEDVAHAGLLPAGFSAEHLGPNDYYYWDDFWGIAGLHAADELLEESDFKDKHIYAEAAEDFSSTVDKSIAACASRLGRKAIPASPYRRLDAGAIGSLVVGYPLQNCAPDDPRLLDSVEYLLEHCFVDGAFFQDMIHSGKNAYLTLHVAQVLLRAGDPRYLQLMDAVANLASPTGQWPEAIHPATKGGCMGDGHHVWAAAEWVMMIRNCFIREEGDTLILCAGVPQNWLDQKHSVSFGPAPTEFGVVSITLNPESKAESQPQVLLQWKAEWRGKWQGQMPTIEVRLPGYKPVMVTSDENPVFLYKKDE